MHTKCPKFLFFLTLPKEDNINSNACQLTLFISLFSSLVFLHEIFHSKQLWLSLILLDSIKLVAMNFQALDVKSKTASLDLDAGDVIFYQGIIILANCWTFN